MKLQHIKKQLLTVALTTVAMGAMAQSLNSAYYTEDYKFRHDLNPAYGNNQNYISIPVLGNVSVNTHGNFGYQDVVMNNPMYGVENGAKKMTTFMNPYISTSDALDGFSTGNNRITGDVNIALLSAGFKGFGGYNTIEVNAKTSFGIALPYELFEFAKNTGNNSYDIGDIRAHAMSYGELALGHSRQINKKLRLGAKLKFLFGIARADVEMNDVKADLTANDKWLISAKAKANMSMKGFCYKQETKEYNDPSKGEYEYVNDVDVDGAGLSGFGMAIDLGGEYKINDSWTVNASVLDLGFMHWSNNMQAANRQDTFVFDGFTDMDVKQGNGNEVFDDKADKYGDQLADFANLTDEGDQGSRTTGIGATINVGASYKLPCYKKMTFGFLSSTRIKGAYSWTEGRLSANWAPLKWLDGGVNFAVNSFTASMGWVLNIHPKGYNLFIGMDHLLGKMSKECIPLSSNASVAVGMNITW